MFTRLSRNLLASSPCLASRSFASHQSLRGQLRSLNISSPGRSHELSLHSRSRPACLRSSPWVRHVSAASAERDLDTENPHADKQEKLTKASILEQVIKGQRPSADDDHTLSLRCTLLDGAGNVRAEVSKLKKAELYSEHHLDPRDLRKLDPRIPTEVWAILVRKGAILVNILHVRALIRADEVILFEAPDSTPDLGEIDERVHTAFLEHLQRNLQSTTSTLPYEFRALESILLSVSASLEAESIYFHDRVGSLLQELEDEIDSEEYTRLLRYARRVGSFESRARLVQRAIEEVLDQDEDMAAMYLTDAKNRRPRPIEQHAELELLLENFRLQTAEAVLAARAMQRSVQSTQEIVEHVLDASRNALLALDVKISIGTLGLGFGAMVAGLFGMNLASGIENDQHAFAAVSAATFVAAGTIVLFSLKRVAKIRKVGLGANMAQKERALMPGVRRMRRHL